MIVFQQKFLVLRELKLNRENNIFSDNKIENLANLKLAKRKACINFGK